MTTESGLPANLARLHALSGVVPLGLFLVVHSALGAVLLAGPDAYEASRATVRSLPLLTAIEVIGIYAPLAFHAMVGLWLVTRNASGRRRRADMKRSRALQQATGVLVLAFIGYHVFHTKVAVMRGVLVPEDQLEHLAALLSSTTSLGVPLPATIYLLGVSATSFHFANGLVRAIRTLRGGDPGRSPLLLLCCAGLGVVLFVITATTVVHLATGTPSWPA